MKTVFSVLLLLLVSCATLSGKDTLPKKFLPAWKDTARAAWLEVSFGNSQLFVSYDKTVSILNKASVVVPTHAILFFAEVRTDRRLRFPVFINLATETKQYIVNGVLENKRASPTFGAGVEFCAFHASLSKRSALEFEAGPVASFLFTEGHHLQFAPVAAGRFRLLRDNSFVMYIGSSYSFGINAFGLLYGTGFLF